MSPDKTTAPPAKAKRATMNVQITNGVVMNHFLNLYVQQPRIEMNKANTPPNRQRTNAT